MKREDMIDLLASLSPESRDVFQVAAEAIMEAFPKGTIETAHVVEGLKALYLVTEGSLKEELSLDDIDEDDPNKILN